MHIPRMTSWLIVSIVLAAILFMYAPIDPGESTRLARFMTLVHKLNLVAMGGCVGYWLDRHIFPYARPDVFLNDDPPRSVLGAAMLRRAIIVGAAMLAVCLGL